MTAEKLQAYLTEHQISGTIISFAHEVRTVEQSHATGDVPLDQIVKSVAFVDEKNTLIVVILLGKDKVDTNKVKHLLNIQRVRVATREEVLEKTGYEAGAVPPIGYDAVFLMDPSVLTKQEVYCGGGSPTTLLKINPQEIVKANHAQSADIKKEK